LTTPENGWSGRRRIVRFWFSAALCLALAALAGPAAFIRPAWGDAPPVTGYTPVPADPSSPEAARLLRLWNSILERHSPRAAFCPDQSPMPSPILLQWKNLSTLAPKLPRNEKLIYINGFFNRWMSEDDQKAYGRAEYWALPEEFLRAGRGDCEDYAIIKYLALRYLAEPAQDMWLLLGKSLGRDSGHAVLAARDGSRVFILDNLSRPAHLLIPEPQYLQSFIPFYAINEQGIWRLTRP
jgi:predicted transglutaminase-like cysteine proteinase